MVDNFYPCNIYIPEINDIAQGVFQDETIFKGVINLDDIHSIDEYFIDTQLVPQSKVSMVHYYNRDNPVVYLIDLDELMEIRKQWIKYRDTNLPLFRKYN